MLGTSTCPSDVLINLGLNPLTRWLREVLVPRKPTVRGALCESTSIAAVYGTDCSLV